MEDAEDDIYYVSNNLVVTGISVFLYTSIINNMKLWDFNPIMKCLRIKNLYLKIIYFENKTKSLKIVTSAVMSG